MDIKETARELVCRMSLEEKASLTSGENFWHMKNLPRLGIEENIMVTDGPHGLRKQTEDADQLGINQSLPATCFPAACATACSFDRALMEEIGTAIGEECRKEEVSVLLGPGVNIKRSPLCGRNFEYFSEDPLVAGEMAASFINGVQSQNVGTSLKHFAANNQETRRMTSESVVDERTMREIYFPAFETAVKKSQPWTVMCSYNMLRGEYASDSRWLLTDVLRRDWGFKGLVVSDWGAVNNRVAGVRAGMDVEMPATSRVNDRKVEQAVRSGALPEAALDEAACRMVELILKARERKPMDYSVEAHHALARKAAAASAVLLKNNNALLPVDKSAKAAVIGAFADKPRFQGAGSSKINPHMVDSPLAELKRAGLDCEYAPGYELTDEAPNETLIAQACKAAQGKDVVIIFAGLPDSYESEGFDRKHIDMPQSHNALIERVAAVNPNTVVVLMCGAVAALPWEEKVGAILLAYLGGEAAGGAVADLLLGKVNPSGKLAESWCYSLSDNPSYGFFPGYARTVEYREGIFVGYRYYDTAGKPVRYPFGYGLSYTHFEYSALNLDKKAMSDGEELTVSFDLTNTGAVAGSETVQLYVASKIKGGVFRPVQELRAFDKIFLESGQKKRVTLHLNRRAFAYYNVNICDWAVESGEYEIRVGASSRDIRLVDTVTVTSADGVKAPDYKKSTPDYYDIKGGFSKITDAEFAALLGRAIPKREMGSGDEHTVNSTLNEIQNRALGRLLVRIIKKKAGEMVSSDFDMDKMIENMLSDAPLRMMLMVGSDMVTPYMLDGLVDLLNHKVIRGISKLLKKSC